MRLHQQDLDPSAARAVDEHLLHGPEVHLVDERLVLPRQGALGPDAPRERDTVQLGRQVHLAPRDDGPRPVGRDLEGVDEAHARDGRDPPAREVQGEERCPALDVRREEDLLSVGSEAEGAHPRVERLGDDPARPGHAVVDREHGAVGLVPGHALHPVGDHSAVRGVARRAVERAVRRGHVPGRGQRFGRPVDRDDPQVGVRRGGGLRVAVRREDQLLAVGGDVEVRAAAHGEGGGVEVARREVARGRLRVGEVQQQQVGALCRPPRRPSGGRGGGRPRAPSSSPSPRLRPSPGCTPRRRRSRATPRR